MTQETERTCICGSTKREYCTFDRAPNNCRLTRARVGKGEVEAILQKFAAVADREYCNGIHMATYDDDTKGWEYRAKNGQYGEAEHKAHEKMNKHFGAHYKIYEVINEIRAALSAQTKPVEPTEFEIALKAREMEKEYNEQFGSDAIRPDFIASAKLALSESSEAKPVEGGMVELVMQQADDDCVPCSLAMLTGLTRQEVLDKVGKLYVAGKGLSHTWRALEALGYSSDDFIGFSTSKDATDYEMDLTLHLAWNRRALVSVPSLNHKGGAHMVYVVGNRVFDPSNKERYTEWTDLRPYEVIIFNDCTR